ncbi:hypothetical protein PVAP13_2NG521903 [Panicum virgatum]|uniref:Uncharacterized protein n=1 Tax=Panicum virgatum TaxID=38727 RepID=A0A8T0VW90_PANVG|nr:hypothetical protein PVAP13_2NG521903 [Panicum virgatum]
MAQPEKIGNTMHSTSRFLEIKIFATWSLVLGFIFIIELHLSANNEWRILLPTM